MKKTNNATISLGKPITAPVLVPVLNNPPPTRCINKPFHANGEWYKVTAMSFGNPHGAVFVEDIDNIDVKAIGPALSTHVLFPKGASIVFIQMSDKESLKARLWQQNEGETDFTPEAACVAGTAAMMLQKVLNNEAIIHMADHTFHVNWDRSTDNVKLTGSADLVQR